MRIFLVVGFLANFIYYANPSHAQLLSKPNCSLSAADITADLYNSLFRGIQVYRAARAYDKYQQEKKKLEPVKRKYEWQLANLAAVYIGHQLKLFSPPSCFTVFFRYYYRKNVTITHYDKGDETYYTIKDINDGSVYFSNSNRWDVLSRLFLKDPGMARLLQPDNDVAKAIIENEIGAYSGPCPCPYNTDANGYQCGKRSAWSRAGGGKPLCYKKDIPSSRMDSFRYYWLREFLN